MPKKKNKPGQNNLTREQRMKNLPIPGPGRYPFFDTPEEMQAGIDKYFDLCKREKRMPGVCALAYALGFLDRHAVREYAKKDAFSAVIKRALLYIESAKENWLHTGTGSTAGIIFDLKNHHGWTDKQEIEHSGAIGNGDMSAYTDEELRKLKEIHDAANARRGERGAVPPVAR